MSLDSLWFEIALIFVFILITAFFSASEIAIIATRKTRIQSLVEKGVRSAAAVVRLKDEPDRFLATVQIGVTIMATLASAIGGAVSIKYLKPVIQSVPVPFVQEWAESLTILVVTAPIAYFSLILGELVPKSLALRYSEQIALVVARPIEFFSRVTSYFVAILTA